MSTVLMILGVVGLIISLFMFGDIGIAGGIASLSALFSGIGLNSVNKRLKIQEDRFRKL